MNKQEMLDGIYGPDDTLTINANMLQQYVREAEKTKKDNKVKMNYLSRQLAEAKDTISSREQECLSTCRELGDAKIAISGLRAKLDLMIGISESRKKQAEIDKFRQPRNMVVDLYI